MGKNKATGQEEKELDKNLSDLEQGATKQTPKISNKDQVKVKEKEPSTESKPQ